MTLRPAHILLLLLAAALAVFGAMIVGRGIFDRSYDNTIWNYFFVGGPPLLIAGLLVGFVVNDARRTPPRRED